MRLKSKTNMMILSDADKEAVNVAQGGGRQWPRLHGKELLLWKPRQGVPFPFLRNEAGTGWRVQVSSDQQTAQAPRTPPIPKCARTAHTMLKRAVRAGRPRHGMKQARHQWEAPFKLPEGNPHTPSLTTTPPANSFLPLQAHARLAAGMEAESCSGGRP